MKAKVDAPRPKFVAAKKALPWFLVVLLSAGWFLDRSDVSLLTPAHAETESPAVMHLPPPADPPSEGYQLANLMERLEASGRNYLPFIRVSTLHAGIYSLPAEAVDRQQPHDEDELYYIIKGKSKFTAGDEVYDVQPGTILYVRAEVAHHFHDIEEDLDIVVFFSTAPPETDAEGDGEE